MRPSPCAIYVAAPYGGYILCGVSHTRGGILTRETHDSGGRRLPHDFPQENTEHVQQQKTSALSMGYSTRKPSNARFVCEIQRPEHSLLVYSCRNLVKGTAEHSNIPTFSTHSTGCRAPLPWLGSDVNVCGRRLQPYRAYQMSPNAAPQLSTGAVCRGVKHSLLAAQSPLRAPVHCYQAFNL